MPNWITSVVVPVGILVLTLAAQFYFKWVPNIEDQKRHARAAAGLAADFLCVGGSATWLYALAQRNGPVTPAFVVEVSLSTACVCFVIVIIVIDKFLSGKHVKSIIEAFNQQLSVLKVNADHTGRIIGIAEKHDAALRCIAEDTQLSAETNKKLERIMNQKPAAMETTKLLS